jgi:hypothetical protein
LSSKMINYTTLNEKMQNKGIVALNKGIFD